MVIGFDLADALPVPIQGTAFYGLMADVDGDGTADIRFGMANTSDTDHLQWLTDLATGHTDHSTPVDNAIAITLFPSQHDRGVSGWIHLEMPRDYEEFRFYLWASQMVNKGVVAIDFAPAEGWIDRP